MNLSLSHTQTTAAAATSAAKKGAKQQYAWVQLLPLANQQQDTYYGIWAYGCI